MRLRIVFAFCLLLLPAVAVRAQSVEVARVASPDGALELRVWLTGEGRPGYSLERRGQPVIEESRLGFLLANEPKLERGFRLAAQATRDNDDRWEQPWGERRFVRNHYRELRTRFTEQAGRQRNLDVVFRVFNDGMGFRYEFPEQASLTQVAITDELTEFAVAGNDATAWWIPAGEWNRYEYLYNRTPLVEVGQAHTPLTLRRADGLHLAFHEAALVDYSAMWLRRVEGQRLKATLSPSASGPRVTRSAPFATPWRTVQVAPTAAALYAASDLTLNLNEPNQLPDIRNWFTPHKYVGVWWQMHLDTHSWGSGPRHGANTANVRRHLDFAAQHGFRGVLVEGWNLGWDGDWAFDGSRFDFTRAYPDFDLEGLASYARHLGVRLIGHHETSGNIAHYEPQLPAALDLYASLGIDAIKTGYVADAGGVQARGPDGKIRFEWHDGQVMARHHLQVVQEAAKRHIAINPHEPIKDTGLRRTWPNWVAREGARGMEYNAWGAPPNPPGHEATLFFTRMLSGPMDFTPGVVSLRGRNGLVLRSTLAKQLALYVVLYSPIQMAADLPEHYEQHAGAFQFIKDVPADWTDTRVLDGAVGEYVAVARQDRNSEDWYLGAVTDEHRRQLTLTLDFLSPGREYEAQVYRDGPAADWQGNGHDLRIETRRVRAGQRWTVRMGPGGGHAVRFRAL